MPNQLREIIIATPQDSGTNRIITMPVWGEYDLYAADTKVLPGVLLPVIDADFIELPEDDQPKL